LFKPDDPLAPPEDVFAEPWQAQALAMANLLIKNGHITANDWANALGAALKSAEASGAPDTVETYYLSVLKALEQVTARDIGVTETDRADRRAAWEAAYKRTPHGDPVEL
jgi:nitrile hydratase accessory protein